MRSVYHKLRLWSAFARFTLAHEMAFRGNFLLKVFVEILWLGILLVFYQTIFHYTKSVAQWTSAEYLFFIGCYYTMEGLLETLFLENCNEFANLVRTGNLDIYLLKPIDEQFLITCRKIDWSTAPKLLIGGGIMVAALRQMYWVFDLSQLAVFSLMFACGTALAYSFLVMLTSSAVWMVRNSGLMELWWMFTTLMRYPRQIYEGGWAGIVGAIFWYLLPVLMVINVPASVIVEKFYSPRHVAMMVCFTAVMLYVSRRFFFFALARYRSASS